MDEALEGAAAILRARGRHAFALGDEDPDSVRATYEQWAAHLLVRSAAPGASTPPPDGRREWRKLERFVAVRAKEEQEHVVRSARDLRDAIFALVESFGRSAVVQERHDASLRQRLESLRAATSSGSLDAIKREALHVAAELTQVLDEQRALARRQTEELRKRLANVSEQLEETRREGETDALTRIANRRAFDRGIERAVTVASVMGWPLTLFMIDIDHFKSINDGYGHPVGDRVLRAIADVLARNFPRRSDLVARYGGEEFAVLLTDTSSADARMLAERLQNAVHAVAIDVASATLRVTLSSGIAQLAPGEQALDLIARADRALYRAKSTGRDRFVCA